MGSVKVMLIVMTMNHGSSAAFYPTPMPDWTTCRQTVKEARIEVSPGDENEVQVAMWCAPSPPINTVIKPGMEE